MKMKKIEIEKIEIFRSQNFSDANFKLLQLFSFSIKLFDFFYGSMYIFCADRTALFPERSDRREAHSGAHRARKRFRQKNTIFIMDLPNEKTCLYRGVKMELHKVNDW